MTTITTGQLPQKNTFTFRTTFNNGLTNEVVFDSDFDSGNCSEIKQNGPNKVNFIINLYYKLC